MLRCRRQVSAAQVGSVLARKIARTGLSLSGRLDVNTFHAIVWPLHETMKTMVSWRPHICHGMCSHHACLGKGNALFVVS